MITLNENIEIIENISLTCEKRIPQVGYKLYDFLYDDDKKVFSEYPENIVDYIINENFEFIIGVGHYKLNKKKLNLISAGRVKIFEGKIVYLDNDSGHYSPNKQHLINIYIFFKKCSMLSDECELYYLNKDNQFEHLLTKDLVI